MEMDNQVQQIQPIAPEETISTPAKAKSKFTLILSGIILLFLVGGGSYFLGSQRSQTKSLTIIPSPTTSLTIHPSPTPSTSRNTVVIPTTLPLIETENWKTPDNNVVGWKEYNNQIGHFSLKYPPEWNYITGGTIDTGVESTSFGENVTSVTEGLKRKLSISVEKASPTGNKDAVTYKNLLLKRLSPRATETNIVIDGIDGYKLEYIDANTKVENIIFEKNNLIYSIILGQHGKSSISTEDHAIYKSIISTIKFTN